MLKVFYTFSIIQQNMALNQLHNLWGAREKRRKSLWAHVNCFQIQFLVFLT